MNAVAERRGQLGCNNNEIGSLSSMHNELFKLLTLLLEFAGNWFQTVQGRSGDLLSSVQNVGQQFTARLHSVVDAQG